jgi:phage anti-repressor protein
MRAFKDYFAYQFSQLNNKTMSTIELRQGPDGQPLVFGRSLFMAVSGYKNQSDFTKWINNRAVGLALEKDVDFFHYKAKVNNEGSTVKQIDLTLSAAIRIAKKEKQQWAVDFLKSIEKREQIKPGESTQPEPTILVSKHKDTAITQPELPLAAPREFSMTEEKPEPEVISKSRSQQLQEQLDQLAREVEAERLREQTEAQNGTEQPGTLLEQLAMLDSRIDGVERKFDALERKVNTVLYFFQQASFAVRSLGPVNLPVEPNEEGTPTAEPTPEPVPTEPTTRMLLVRLVNSFAAADRKTEHDTWKWLYGQYDLRKGFNVYAQAGPSAKGKDESYLTVIEQHGHIEELYKLAKKLMTLPELR